MNHFQGQLVGSAFSRWVTLRSRNPLSVAPGPRPPVSGQHVGESPSCLGIRALPAATSLSLVPLRARGTTQGPLHNPGCSPGLRSADREP